MKRKRACPTCRIARCSGCIAILSPEFPAFVTAILRAQMRGPLRPQRTRRRQ